MPDSLGGKKTLREKSTDRVNSLRFAVTLTALLVSTGAAFAGPVTYIYTGNDFTDAEYPLKATDSIDISMTLAAPLGDNLVDQSVTPLSFTFSDGYSVDDASKPVNWVFNFNTDGLGNITGWEVVVDLADGNLGGTVNGIKEGNETLPMDVILTPPSSSFNMGDPGTWVETSASVAPEPASISVMILGLAALSFRRVRRADSSRFDAKLVSHSIEPPQNRPEREASNPSGSPSVFVTATNSAARLPSGVSTAKYF